VWLAKPLKAEVKINTMTAQSTHEAAIPNPALEALSILVGEWETVGKHVMLPDTLHGHVSFEWLEGGAFLMMKSTVDEPGVPSNISVIGSDDESNEFFMLYFDERGVSRRFVLTLQDHVLKIWRIVPNFSQRFTGTFANNGDTIIGLWELNRDNATWNRDLDVTYTRVKRVEGAS